MNGEVSTSLDDWFEEMAEYRRVRFRRSDVVLMESMAVCERVSIAEIIRRSVRDRFLLTWPANISHDS